LGAAGVSYDVAKRLFSMVILQTHFALLWAPVGRRYHGYSIGPAIASVVLVIFVSQILIWEATIFSYLTGFTPISMILSQSLEGPLRRFPSERRWTRVRQDLSQIVSWA